MHHLRSAGCIDGFVPVIEYVIVTIGIVGAVHLHYGIVAIRITTTTGKYRPVSIPAYIIIVPTNFKRIVQTLWYFFIRRLAIKGWFYRLFAIIHFYILPVVFTKMQIT